MADIVVWWSAISTTALALISFTVLYFSLKQNREMLEHNRQMLKKAEMQNRPFFSKESAKFTMNMGIPAFEVWNIGEKGAVVDYILIYAFLKKFTFRYEKKNAGYIVRKDQPFVYMLEEGWTRELSEIDRKQKALVVLRYKHESDHGNSNSSFYRIKHEENLTEEQAKQWDDIIEVIVPKRLFEINIEELTEEKVKE